MTVSAFSGPRWLISSRSELSLLATAGRTWKAGKPEYSDFGARVEVEHRLTPKTNISVRTSFVNRKHSSNSMLDAPVSSVSLGVSHLLKPTLRATANVGWSRERPMLERSRNTSRQANVGLTALLSGGLTIGGGVGVQWTDWRGNWFPEVLDGSARRDKTRTVKLNVHHRGFTIFGFSPQLTLTRGARDSNSQIHDYRRLFGEVSFVRPLLRRPIGRIRRVRVQPPLTPLKPW